MFLSGGAGGAFALVLEQQALSDADGLRGDLDELVVGDEFDGRFERVADRGHAVAALGDLRLHRAVIVELTPSGSGSSAIEPQLPDG